MMTIDKKITILGNDFKGLWRSIVLIKNKYNIPTPTYGWSVTYKYHDELVETPYMNSAHEALDYAISIVKG